jgi:hypothetical protein
MEKISWTDRVRNEDVLLRVKTQRNILHEIRKREENWIGHISKARFGRGFGPVVRQTTKLMNEYNIIGPRSGAAGPGILYRAPALTSFSSAMVEQA